MATKTIRMLFFVSEQFPTYRVDVDVLFGRELLGRNHAIDFVMQAANDKIPAGPQPWRGRTVWVGATDTGDGFLRRLRKHMRGFWHDVRSLALASPDRYDAVQVRDKALVGALALVVARIRGLKFFYWLSFPRPEAQMMRASEGNASYPWLTYIQGAISWCLLYRWILPRCDHAFVQSQQMRTDVSAHGISAAKLTPVPMGIAVDDLPAETAKAAAGSAPCSATLTLVYLGTLNTQRRLDVLVDMLSLLRRQGLKARLLLVGDGARPDDRALVERRARDLDVEDQLEITGFLPRSDALGRVQGSDICLSPFFPTPVLRSTSPTKLVEYLALGLPVVANDHPEQRLVLRESRAGVCVPWGARHFARAVTWLAKRSPTERRLMGERGRRWVLENRTYSRIADELEHTYLDLLAGGTR